MTMVWLDFAYTLTQAMALRRERNIRKQCRVSFVQSFQNMALTQVALGYR